MNVNLDDPRPRLFMVLLGSKAPGRTVEQHDFYFGIANSLKELVPYIKAFWPEAVSGLHIDGWREVTRVDNYKIEVNADKEEEPISNKKLFFINLGGYQSGKLQEQHYTVLSVHDDRTAAVRHSKSTLFFKTNGIKGAGTHIDEKYGIDVDDIYRIEDVLSPDQKKQYSIKISASEHEDEEDPIHLGYFKLDKIR